MNKLSAGILIYRIREEHPEVLLVHPGGPFYVKKDLGVWSVPKGEHEEGEDPLKVAKREFEEETGNIVTAEKFIPLSPVVSKGGKTLSAWAAEDNFDRAFIQSNLFELEWPPRSGKKQSFPEVDNAEWFTFEEARKKVFSYQLPLLNELESIISKG